MRTVFIPVLMALLAGCGSERGPATTYYKLDIPPAPAPVGPSAPAALRIEPLRTTSLLRQDRIIYRPSPGEVGFYEYHRWAESPHDAMTKAIADQLARRQVFESVQISDDGEKPDYVLKGTIDRLQEVDFGGVVRAQVSISAALEDPEGRQIWSGAASSEAAVSISNVQAVVAAMGQASQKSVAELVGEISKFVQVTRLATVSSKATSQH